MRHRKISLSNKAQQKIPYYDFDYSESNENEIAKMKKILKNAIVTGLTERQRYCICQYYIEEVPMKEIAHTLGVNPSTVTRHIKNAKKNLKRIADCYC